MVKRGKHYFWVFANLYGFVFGWPFLARFHKMLMNLSAHGLGYDNALRLGWTGEERFIRKALGGANADIGVCVDVGANKGAYTELLLKHIPGVTVYALEPMPDSYLALSERFKDTERVVPLCLALADYEGTGQMYAGSATAETASLDSRVLASSSVEAAVTVTTLDAFVEAQSLSRVDFIKIDTEGYEREVLAGGVRSIARLRPRFVQFEFNILHLRRGYALPEITRFLPEYIFYRLLPHGWIRIDPTRFADNLFMFSNVIAVRNDVPFS